MALRAKLRDRLLALAALALALSLAAARADKPAPDPRRAIVENYAAVVHASYVESASRAAEMDAAVGAFLAAPGDETLAAAKAAWVRAREAYGQTEAYRFYGGPIDSAESGVEPLLNAWPLDEAYLDYTIDEPNGGLVNNPERYSSLTAGALAKLNLQNGEEEVATGFHAIEFLLWGQDLDPNGPGARSWRDYAPGEGAPNAERRAAVLRNVSSLAKANLDYLVREWAPGADNYRATFVADDPAESLQKIVTGIGMLAGDELAGERMAVAYETGDQEDEQSCFSDTTRADLIANAKGIDNVYRGRWADEIDGPGLDELIAAADPALAKKIEASLQAALEAFDAIPHPFDQALQNTSDPAARAKLLAAIEAVERLALDLAKGAEALGLQINIEAAE